jgi:dihydroxyacid dehydratase/phosphogluconate dehydratase
VAGDLALEIDQLAERPLPGQLEGGPIGKLVDGDLVRIVIDTRNLEASVELVGHGDEAWGPDEAATVLEERPINPAIRPDDALPADTALWASLQSVSGGLWGGCVYDVESIRAALDAGALDTTAADRRLSSSLT